MRPVLGPVILAMLVSISGAVAQPADEPLPFGLDQIHWKMSTKDVSAAISGLAPQTKAPDDSPMTNQAASHFEPYRWRGCTFSVSLYFADDKLDNIDLDATAVSPTCQSAAKAELNAHYGKGNEIAQRVLQTKMKFGENIKWTSSDSTAVYNGIDDGRFVEIGLSESNAPPLMIADPVQGSRPIAPRN